MANRNAKAGWIPCALALCLVCLPAAAQDATTVPSKVYVPYEKLKGVFESEKQGVFLPYGEFRRLWAAAQGAPAGVKGVPVPYLISTARFTGQVGTKLASMQLELTVDILADDWVEVPVALGEVGVAKAAFADADAKDRPLLRVVNGQYRLLTKGKGRHVLKVDFVRQLVTKPGLNVLSFRIPPAAISTLELLIPGENMKVDVKPMLAATTTQVDDKEGKKATRLQAFLGAAKQVELSWKPKTQAAAELAPVIIAEQLQHIHVAEALVSHSVKFTYDVRRRGVDSFTIQLPGDFRVIAVEGANISKWDIPARPGNKGPQNLQVNLFSPAKGACELTVKMERFLKEPSAEIALTPILTQQALRRTGLIGITHSPRRSVEVQDARNLARVDTGRLPKDLGGRPGATAWRFITADYAGKLVIAAVDPRITVSQLWALGVHTDRLELRGRLNYTVERAGVFELSMNLPDPWEVVSVGPASIVDDHRLAGKGPTRSLNILLKAERAGSFSLNLTARAPQPKPDAPVSFALPLADAKYLKLYSGSLVLFLPEKLRAEVEKLDQLQAMPLKAAARWTSLAGLSPAMAFEFRSVDRTKPAGASFKIILKPTQVSAVVHRLVNIEPGRLEQEAIVRYRVRYAPVDTFYLKMPAAIADEAQITGDPNASLPRIKEKPRIDSLPADQLPKAPAATQPAGEAKWAYFKVVLQSPVTGQYEVKVTTRQSFQAAEGAKPTDVVVHPILAAGRLADQSGHIAVAKADTLAVLEPAVKGLTPADPSSPTDLPYEPHRRRAALAFKYTAAPFELSLPVVVQKEADVFATMVSAAVIEQVLAPDRTLNTRAIYVLATSRGDRLAITLPARAVPYQFLLNGKEQAVEPGATPEERIVRLPPSAGQVSRFVLEISYNVPKAKPGALEAPALPGGVPFQQTLWRIWLPEDDYVLGYDRDFSRVTAHEANLTLQAMARDAPAEVAFGPSHEGRLWDFVRQGRPGKLSIALMNKKWFSILVWAVVLGGGAAMLKLCWFRRLLLDLGAAAALLVVYLFAPLLVVRLCMTAIPAAVIVAVLWVVHWLFLAAPGYFAARRRAGPAPAASPPTNAQPPKGKQHPANDGQAEKGQ